MVESGVVGGGGEPTTRAERLKPKSRYSHGVAAGRRARFCSVERDRIRVESRRHFMRAAVAVAQSATDPIAGLVVQDVPEPEVPEGWVKVRVRAASLNPHDLWTLRGVGHPAERIPMILGCDGAGELDGRRVLLHGVIGNPDAGGGDETLDLSLIHI